MSAERAELFARLARLVAEQGEVLAELARLEGLRPQAPIVPTKPPARRRRAPPVAVVPSLPPPTELGRARARAILRRLGHVIPED